MLYIKQKVLIIKATADIEMLYRPIRDFESTIQMFFCSFFFFLRGLSLARMSMVVSGGNAFLHSKDGHTVLIKFN